MIVRKSESKAMNAALRGVVMQVLMGFSTADIARELGLSGAAVLTRLFRARKQLRVLCGEDTKLDPQE